MKNGTPIQLLKKHHIIATNHQPMKHNHSKTLYKGLAPMYHWRLETSIHWNN